MRRSSYHSEPAPVEAKIRLRPSNADYIDIQVKLILTSAESDDPEATWIGNPGRR